MFSSAVDSVNSELFIMLSSSSNERAIVSSPSFSSKKPPVDLSSVTISCEGSVSSVTVSSVETTTLAAAAFFAASFDFMSERFCLRVLISFFKLDKSLIICCNKLLSTAVVLFGTSLAGSISSLLVLSFISFTTGAVFVSSFPTLRS